MLLNFLGSVLIFSFLHIYQYYGGHSSELNISPGTLLCKFKKKTTNNNNKKPCEMGFKKIVFSDGSVFFCLLVEKKLLQKVK